MLAAAAKAAGAELLAVINASPFHAGKGDEREQAMRLRVLATGLPLVYAHLVGGQDEIVFEGCFALDRNGALAARARASPRTCSRSRCSRRPRPLPARRAWCRRSKMLLAAMNSLARALTALLGNLHEGQLTPGRRSSCRGATPPRTAGP